MRSSARVKSVNSKSVNQNDIDSAALALVALNLTHPDAEDEEYAALLDKFWEEHCPLSNVPKESLTPRARRMDEARYNAIMARADEMEDEMLSSGDPLFRALAVQRATAK
jgi:hypothetical protein